MGRDLQNVGWGMKPLEQLLAETKAIVEAATPGPWELSKHNPTEILQIYDAESGEWVCEPVDEETGAFIAHARTMMPLLIEALELAVENQGELIYEIARLVDPHASPKYQNQCAAEVEAVKLNAIADIIRKAGDR